MKSPAAATCPPRAQAAAKSKPRLAFLGVGWIGRNRLEAIAATDLARIVAIADPSRDSADEAAHVCPDALVFRSFDGLLEVDADGVVIATPSALHAEQAVLALERGLAVFCQKPLGRNTAETARVISAARAADRLLGVDLSYRHLSGARRIYELCRSGDLGSIYAADLVFHNAYGPDKPWFYDRQLSGGGCVIDLGIHLVDLALWVLNFVPVIGATSRLFAKGRPVRAPRGRVEDYAVARLDLADGTAMDLSCSWHLPAGCDAVISASFYGTEGGAALRNVDGSFYDFVAERFAGTRREVLAGGPEPWGGRAAVDWVRRLVADRSFDPAIESLGAVAAALDAIYGSAGGNVYTAA